MKQSFLIVIFVTAFSTSVFAQAPAGTPADPVAGKAKFEMFCATCHGPAGLGDGAAAATLTPKPRNLQATTQTDEQLKKIITEGGAANGLSPLMPPWGGALTPQDVANVVAHIRTLKKK